MLAHLHLEIQEELASLTLFDDVLPTLDALYNKGIPLAICSNGDTWLADFEGPTKFGFRTKHLVRGQPSEGDSIIASLSEILRMTT